MADGRLEAPFAARSQKGGSSSFNIQQSIGCAKQKPSTTPYFCSNYLTIKGEATNSKSGESGHRYPLALLSTLFCDRLPYLCDLIFLL